VSYCRWSSDGWRSDVYCYEDVKGGWTTHVAGLKRVGLDTLIPIDPDLLDFTAENATEWTMAHSAFMRALEKLEMAPIGLPHDGETFRDPTLEAFKARLVMLRDEGYHVPADVFEAIDEELAATRVALRTIHRSLGGSVNNLSMSNVTVVDKSKTDEPETD